LTGFWRYSAGQAKRRNPAFHFFEDSPDVIADFHGLNRAHLVTQPSLFTV